MYFHASWYALVVLEVPRGIPHFYLSIGLTKKGIVHFDLQKQKLIMGRCEDP